MGLGIFTVDEDYVRRLVDRSINNWAVRTPSRASSRRARLEVRPVLLRRSRRESASGGSHVPPSYLWNAPLEPIAPHLFHNSSPGQANSRKFVGVVLDVNGTRYFAPLSSFKPKHRRMKNGLDFIKIGDYAVINLNCMFPVPEGLYRRVDFSREADSRYRSLLRNEYRIIRSMEEKIVRNARNLYQHKLANGDSTKLAARYNDFLSLEKACEAYCSRRDS